MSGELYIALGTQVKINGEGDADYAWSAQGLTNTAGRVSVQIDLGAAPRPYLFKWWCSCMWQATPTQGAILELYKVGAPDGHSTLIEADIGTSDAAMGDVDMRRNMDYIGACVSENAAAAEMCNKGGVFEHYQRYLSLACYNGAGATLNATASNFIFYLQPVFGKPQ
jgi:hypothetical protein